MERMIRSTSRSELFQWAAVTVVAMLAVHHMAVTVLYVLPWSPLKLATLKYVQFYIEPYFYQRWSLFAPDPISNSKFILASCRIRQADGTSIETGWRDATSRFDELHQRYRLGPAQRVQRALISPIYMVSHSGDRLTDAIAQQAEETKDPTLVKVAEALTQSEETQRQSGIRIISRVASAECHRAFPHATVTDVRAQVVLADPVPFSMRQKSAVEGNYTRYTFDWKPFETLAAIP